MLSNFSRPAIENEIKIISGQILYKMPVVPKNGVTAVNFNGFVYHFGGKPETFHKTAAYKFDGKWTQIQDLSGRRYGHRSVVVGNSIFHIGGRYNEVDIGRVVKNTEISFFSL